MRRVFLIFLILAIASIGNSATYPVTAEEPPAQITESVEVTAPATTHTTQPAHNFTRMPIPEATLAPEPTPETTAIPQTPKEPTTAELVSEIRQLTPELGFVSPLNEADIIAMAQTLYGEANCVKSAAERAMVL